MNHSDGLQWRGKISKGLKKTMSSGQLPMFMTPNEILATYRPATSDRLFIHQEDDPRHDCDISGCDWETNDQMYRRKLSESKWMYTKPLPEDIAENGVRTPVQLVNYKDVYTGKNRSYVGNGHHRIVSAHTVKPDTLIPVEHF